MTHRVEIVGEVSAPPEQIFALLRREHAVTADTPGERVTWSEPSPTSADGKMIVTAAAEGRHLTLSAEYEVEIPYFSWAFSGLIRRSVRGHLRHLAARFDAAAAGGEPPAEPKHPWWAPPEAMSTEQVATVATLSFLLAIIEYANSLLTQTVDFVAKTFEATNAQLGTVTAVTRVGNLIVLVGGVMTDRVGRRRLLLVAVSIVLTATVLSGVAPNLFAFGVLQVFVNGATNLAFLVGFILAVEEAPEAARTYTIAIVGVAAGLGFALGAVLLPVADVHPHAWRALYGLAAVGFLFLPSIARGLRETKRYVALVARNAERGRVGEVVDRTYGSRFVILCIAGFLVNCFLAPQSQFANRFLSDERGFSGLGILVLRAVTQTVPAFGAAYVGGKLAESRGRRPVARDGLIVAALGMAGFFVVGGPMLWILFALGSAGQALAGPSLSAFTTELFPTEVRGTAGAGLTITGVLGSATGLLAAGYLAAPLGSIGTAVAVTSIAPLIVAVFFIRHLPEAKGRLLDEVSPSEV